MHSILYEQAKVAVTPLAHIREVLGSNTGLDTGHPYPLFMIFLSLSRQVTRLLSPSGHDNFFPIRSSATDSIGKYPMKGLKNS
jgi:hypothetical protein